MSEQYLQQELREAKREIERLRLSVKELNHRCLNEWQALAAIVENETHPYQTWIPRDSLTRILTYICLTGKTHHLLAQAADTGVERVSLRALLDALGSLLQETHCGTRLRFEVEEIPLPRRQCGSLALICSELICNAVKQGASQIIVTFRVCEECGYLQVSDDGPGFPDNFDPKVSANTGLEVVETLCRSDLNGEMRYGNGWRGAQVMVIFPLT